MSSNIRRAKKYPRRDRLALRHSEQTSQTQSLEFRKTLGSAADTKAQLNTGGGAIPVDGIQSVSGASKLFAERNYSSAPAVLSATDIQAKEQLSKQYWQRLDNRKPAIVFDQSATVTAQKLPPVLKSGIQNSHSNITALSHNITAVTGEQTVYHKVVGEVVEISEAQILDRHLLIADDKWDKSMLEVVRQVLPYAYMPDFGTIRFFSVNDLHVELVGPYKFSKSMCDKLGLDYEVVQSSHKHIWVFDCPKYRVENPAQTDPQFRALLEADPYVKAFGLPAPDGYELEGLQVLAKVARHIGAKILSCDTGNFFQENAYLTHFIWHLPKLLPPEQLAEVLQNYGSVPQLLPKQVVGASSVAGLQSHLSTRIKWNYFENAGTDSQVAQQSRRVAHNWSQGYSFTAPFGISSLVSITTVAEDIAPPALVELYNKKDAKSSAYSKFENENTQYDYVKFRQDTSETELRMVSYTFSWRPRQLEILSRENLPLSLQREQKEAMDILKDIAGKLATKYGGHLLSADGFIV